ncbi:MAG: thiol peroxidase, partial [Candidatus Competibacteraceae bacterium]|nr:thiol peroxidase [Candidatus Competibacteraceae bacterium]
MAQVTFRGTPCNTNGEPPKPGAQAPDFQLSGSDLSVVSLDTYAGKKKIINIVPSLDTGVCATSTRKFNAEATKLSDTVVLVVSADLPFAQQRFCGAESMEENVKTLSMMRDRNFARDYGVLITDGPVAGLAARAVV